MNRNIIIHIFFALGLTVIILGLSTFLHTTYLSSTSSMLTAGQPLTTQEMSATPVYYTTMHPTQKTLSTIELTNIPILIIYIENPSSNTIQIEVINTSLYYKNIEGQLAYRPRNNIQKMMIKPNEKIPAIIIPILPGEIEKIDIKINIENLTRKDTIQTTLTWNTPINIETNSNYIINLKIKT